MINYVRKDYNFCSDDILAYQAKYFEGEKYCLNFSEITDTNCEVYKKIHNPGFMGLVGEGLIDFYSYVFDISRVDAGCYMIVTLIFLGCLLTCLGFFDKWVHFSRCGLIVPITGFAHAMMSAALEYRREGLVMGIGANMLKLAGSVIIYGVVSAYTFGILRYLIMGG